MHSRRKICTIPDFQNPRHSWSLTGKNVPHLGVQILRIWQNRQKSDSRGKKFSKSPGAPGILKIFSLRNLIFAYSQLKTYCNLLCQWKCLQLDVIFFSLSLVLPSWIPKICMPRCVPSLCTTSLPHPGMLRTHINAACLGCKFRESIGRKKMMQDKRHSNGVEKLIQF